MRRLRFESLESRVVLDASTFSLVGQTPGGWATFNNFDIVGGTLSNGEMLEEGWPIKAFADFTKDGVTDVLVKPSGGNWELHVNDGFQLYAVPWSQAANGVNAAEAVTLADAAQFLDVADFNMDGAPDVALYDPTSGEVWVAIGEETHLTNQLWATLPSGVAESRVFVGDFSGDGAPDVLTGIDGGRWILGRSSTTLDALGPSNWGNFPDYSWEQVVAGDFNGDSIDDVAAMAPDKTWWVWSGGPTGFGPAEYFGHWKMADDWYDLGVADFDNDGREDIIGRTGDGELYVASATPEGRFHTWRWGTGWVHGADWSSIAHVDFNDDGRIDQVGHAADGTWWYADNQEVNFRNRYISSTQAFVSAAEWHVIPNFTEPNTVDVSTFKALAPVTPEKEEINSDLSESESEDDPLPFVGRAPSLRHDNRIVRTTIDDNGFVTLLGPEINLLGVQIESRGGHLTPIEGSPDPFDLLLENSPSSVVLGNLGRLQLLENGRFVLPVSWDSNAGVNDLVVLWGGIPSSGADGPLTQGRAFIDDDLAAILEPEPEPVPDTPTNQPPSEISNSESDVYVTAQLSAEGFIVLHGNGQLAGLTINSHGGHLFNRTSHAAPFTYYLSNTREQVAYGNLGTTVPLPPEGLPLPLKWDPIDGPDDLDITWLHGRDIVEVKLDETFSDAYTFRSPEPEERVTADTEKHVTAELNADNSITLIGNAAMSGVEFKSRGGHLTNETDDAAPFTFYLANSKNQVTYGNLGSTVRLSPEGLSLALKWDPIGGPDDLTISWGDGPNPADVTFGDSFSIASSTLPSAEQSTTQG